MKINAHNRLRNPMFANNIEEHAGTILSLLSKELKLPLTRAKPRRGHDDVFELPLSSKDFGVLHLAFLEATVLVSLYDITKENAILAKVELYWVYKVNYKSTTSYGRNGHEIGRFAYYLDSGEFKLL